MIQIDFLEEILEQQRSALALRVTNYCFGQAWVTTGYFVAISSNFGVIVLLIVFFGQIYD
jgi:hypothetical protein